MSRCLKLHLISGHTSACSLSLLRFPQDADCSVPSDWMRAGESHLPLVPPVPNGFVRKVILRPWVYNPTLRAEAEQFGRADRYLHYQPWDDEAGKPTGTNLRSLSQQGSVEEYLRHNPQLDLSLDSFSFERWRTHPSQLSAASTY